MFHTWFPQVLATIRDTSAGVRENLKFAGNPYGQLIRSGVSRCSKQVK